MKFSPSWAAQRVSAFEASGVHRASTPGDYASGEWLSLEAREAGARVSRMSVSLPRTVVEEACIELADTRIDGLPMFDSPPAARIEGRFGPCGEDCEIGYLELAPNAASIKGMSFETLRRESKHAAIVVATRVAGESLAPINAQYYHAPFGPVVLLVAGMHHGLLAQLASSKDRVALTSRHHRDAAESFNVVARVSAAPLRPAPLPDPRITSGAPPLSPTAGERNTASRDPQSGEHALVVLTPRTGWWESTAERGGGLVAWLAALHTASALREQQQLRREVHAFATCGHELGHVGLHHLLKEEARLLQASVQWLHLGANLGCASNAALIVRASEPADAEHMRALLGSEGYPTESIRVDPISTASGEARDVMEHGGMVLSMIGSNAHFHAASDRWPSNVNAARVAAISRAVSRWLVERACA